MSSPEASPPGPSQPPQPRTLELASSILEHTTIVETFLQQNGLPSPSFNPGTPPKLPLSPEVEKSLEAALSAMDELMALLLGPMGWLLNQIGHGFDLASLHAMYRHKIPSKFPVGSKISIHELSQLCLPGDGDSNTTTSSEELTNLQENLSRLLRHAVSNYLLLQDSPNGPVSHSSLSAMMAHVPALDDWIGSACEDMWPSAPHILSALQLPQKTAHNLAENTHLNFFQTLRSQPARMSRFANSMTIMQSVPGYDASAALEAYDWPAASDEKKLTVVDVGGGQNGDFAAALVAKYPDLIQQVVVQDLDLVDTGSSPDNDSSLVKFMSHDFFTPQPIQAAHVYFFRMVFHDWPDEACMRILRQQIPAMRKRPGSRIVINDFVVPASGSRSRYLERQTRCQDVAMMAMFGSKERDEDEWRELVGRADGRFRVAGVKMVGGSGLGVLEVVLEGED